MTARKSNSVRAKPIPSPEKAAGPEDPEKRGNPPLKFRPKSDVTHKERPDSYEGMLTEDVEGTPVDAERVIEWCARFIRDVDEIQRATRFLIEDLMRLRFAAQNAVRKRTDHRAKPQTPAA